MAEPNLLTDTDQFPEQVRAPGTGERATEATFARGLQDVADRTRYLKNRLSDEVRVASPTGVAATDTANILAAISAALSTGARGILLGPGLYRVTSDAVATNEGPAITLGGSVANNFTIRGAGRGVTKIEPASNKVECILVHGVGAAAMITVEDLTFTNSANGRLQNQVKPSSNTPGGGVAGLGNLANCAIRVGTAGAGLTVRRCDFHEFTVDIHYIGNATDDDVLVGTYIEQDTAHYDCGFGALVEQPEIIQRRGVRAYRWVSVVNASTTDPGHSLYVTNRGGAHPRVVQVSDDYGEDGTSSSIKIRKGQQVTVSNCTAHHCGRGIEFWDSNHVVATNLAIVMDASKSDEPPGTNMTGLEIVDLGAAEISNVRVDRNGSPGWCVRIRADNPALQPWCNKNVHLRDVTMVDDQSGTTVQAALIATEQLDLVLENCRYIHSGSVASSRRPFDLRGCTRARVIRPAHQTDGSPSDASHLVSLDTINAVPCTNCVVEWSTSDISVAPTGNTFFDGGTGNVFRRIVGSENNVLSVPAAFAYGDHDTIVVSADVDSLAVNADITYVRLQPNAVRQLLGIAAPNPATRRVLKLYNDSSFPIEVRHNASSVDADRIRTPGASGSDGHSYYMLPGSLTEFIYDVTSSRWRIEGQACGYGHEFDDGLSGAADTIDWRRANHHRSVLTANCTFTYTLPLIPGWYSHKLIQDTPGGHSVTLPVSVLNKSALETALNVQTGPDVAHLVVYWFDGTAFWGQLFATAV